MRVSETKGNGVSFEGKVVLRGTVIVCSVARMACRPQIGGEASTISFPIKIYVKVSP